MQKSGVIDGRVLYCDNATIYCAKGYDILVSKDSGASWNTWASLSGKHTDGFLQSNQFHPLLKRLLRRGIHHLSVAPDGSGVVFSNNESFSVREGKVTRLGANIGSRPLTVCQVGGTFYYGEYRRNPERTATHIWKWQAGDQQWSAVWEFDDIRHVHGVYCDEYTGAIWVTTGDYHAEVGIWRTDDGFATLEKVAGGSQQLRTVQLLFTENYMYFGSDAPEEKNHIYRRDRSSGVIETVCAVGGPVFFGCKVDNSLYFSTVVEPSHTNTSRYAEVWCSANESSCGNVLKLEKDKFSMRYFQYGMILFPAGPGDNKSVYLSPIATEHHGKTLIYANEVADH